MGQGSGPEAGEGRGQAGGFVRFDHIITHSDVGHPRARFSRRGGGRVVGSGLQFLPVGYLHVPNFFTVCTGFYRMLWNKRFLVQIPKI